MPGRGARIGLVRADAVGPGAELAEILAAAETGDLVRRTGTQQRGRGAASDEVPFRAVGSCVTAVQAARQGDTGEEKSHDSAARASERHAGPPRREFRARELLIHRRERALER